MKIIDNIKVKFKSNEEKINFSLSPEIQNYYDSIKPEFYDAIIKSSKTIIKDNNIFIRFLKIKLQENKNCSDFYLTSRYEDIIKREILDREYINNSSRQVVEYVQYKKKRYIEEKRAMKMKKGESNGEEFKPNN